MRCSCKRGFVQLLITKIMTNWSSFFDPPFLASSVFILNSKYTCISETDSELDFCDAQNAKGSLVRNHLQSVDLLTIRPFQNPELPHVEQFSKHSNCQVAGLILGYPWLHAMNEPELTSDLACPTHNQSGLMELALSLGFSTF
jgi:hypothetical protein